MKKYSDNEIITHAKQEMHLLEMIGVRADPVEKQMAEYILDLLEVFTNQDHNDISAAFCINMFSRLAMGLPVASYSDDMAVQINGR